MAYRGDEMPLPQLGEVAIGDDFGLQRGQRPIALRAAAGMTSDTTSARSNDVRPSR